MSRHLTSTPHAVCQGRGHLFNETYIRAERGNVPSIIGVERAGFKPGAGVVQAAFSGISIGSSRRGATWAPRKWRSPE